MTRTLRLVPPGDAVAAEDPRQAREEIRRTRARMSGTLNEIEGLLSDRRERLRLSLDPRERVRAAPLAALGGALGVGLLLGLVTGG